MHSLLSLLCLGKGWSPNSSWAHSLAVISPKFVLESLANKPIVWSHQLPRELLGDVMFGRSAAHAVFRWRIIHVVVLVAHHYYWLNALLTDFSDKRNLITIKATGLNFSLFNIDTAQEVPFGMPQYVQYILYALTTVLFCVYSFLLTVKSVDWWYTWWLPLHNKQYASTGIGAIVVPAATSKTILKTFYVTHLKE